MPENPIDPEFVEDARAGHFPADDFIAYVNEDGNEEIREYVDEALDNGLSLEWAAMSYAHDLDPDFDAWDHATIARTAEGDWSVIVVSDGESHVFTFADEEAAQDLIWADLYFHLTEYGVEFDKDIDSGEAA